MIFSKRKKYGFAVDTGLYALQSVRNDLMIQGAEFLHASVEIMIPESVNKKLGYDIEKRLKKEMKQICVDMRKIEIYVDPYISVPCVEVLGYGKEEECHENLMQMKDIIVLGTIGFEGILRVIGERDGELKKRFSLSFLEDIKRKHCLLDVSKQVKVLKLSEKSGESKIFMQVGDGGIFSALWELSVAKKCGFEIDLKKLPVLQETIEICECYRMNPYRLASTGCLIVLAKDGEALVEELEEQGIFASFIGSLTDKNDKLLINGEEVRYLDRPVPDEMRIILS